MYYSTIKNNLDDLDASIKWEPSQGVSPQMLFEICKILHISHYAFDVTNNCFYNMYLKRVVIILHLYIMQLIIICIILKIKKMLKVLYLKA